eukprot:scaffold14854_cov129-Isochrysis_galbana.AAC.11
MAPRRPGTEPTEADPTSDIGAKRARVVGEDENSTQVRLRARTRACKPACTVTAHILVWLLAAALAVCAQRLRKFASTKGCECSKKKFFTDFSVARAPHPHQSLPDPLTPPLLSLPPNPSPYHPTIPFGKVSWGGMPRTLLS